MHPKGGGWKQTSTSENAPLKVGGEVVVGVNEHIGECTRKRRLEATALYAP